MSDSVHRTSLRTHAAGELRAEDIGASVRLAGWVQRRRDLGGLVFIDLRDRWGTVQVSLGPDWADASMIDRARRIGSEDVVSVEGTVRARPDEAVNPEMATGAVEVQAGSVEVLAPSETPPILVTYGPDEELAAEELRLRYRFLDLRRAELQRNFLLRHRVVQAIRAALDAESFVEVETPILTRPTPEGARDYLAPSRVHRGEFYALPQSPQLYKQILMVAGFDRYFQIARCLRDEDLRADRQPEFTQLDLEMSFVAEDDIFAVGERVMAAIWEACADREIDRPFPRIPYRDALERYGTDKPDLRIPWTLTDVSDVVEDSEFRIFSRAVAEGDRVRGLRVPEGGSLSRKDLDELDGVAGAAGAPGVLWTRISGTELSGGFGGRMSDAEVRGLRERFEGEDGDLLLIVAGADWLTSAALDALRRRTAEMMEAVESDDRFAWITEFPLLERDRETGELVPSRHPFTAPLPDDEDGLESDPSAVRLRAYDMVCNGHEFGSGSIRINRADLQSRVFRALGVEDDEARRRFGFLLDAFRYGAPPHGGFALGIDRIVMELAGARSLRDVIAFPKTTAARALMEGAPAPVPATELEDLGIEVTENEDHERNDG